MSNVSMELGNFRLADFNLEVRDGEYYILLGPTGAGKSLILETVAGLRSVSSGRIEVDGKDVTGLPPEKRSMGYVPQDGLLMPFLNVRDNIFFSAGIRGIPEKSLIPFFNYLTDVLEIGSILNERGSTLSGGERQKTAIARAMLLKPRLLLLDEPLSSLDLPVKRKIIKALGEIHADTGVTFLHVTHDQDEAFMLGDVISVLIKGKIEQTSRKNRLYYFPRTLQVARFTGMGNIFTGHVLSAEKDTGNVKIKCGQYVFTSLVPEYQKIPEPGRDVYFGIRAEEVMILRKGEDVKTRLKDNTVSGYVKKVMEKSSSHTVYFSDKDNKLNLEIELTNLVYRRLDIIKGGEIEVSLKSSSIWISLEEVVPGF
jgi:molybdate transport system ATP-binding protein/molybdate/tungstate transport system ATP-binding protein